MTKSENTPPKKSRGWLWKLPLGLLVLLSVVLVGVILTFESIALDQINRAMQDSLSAGGRVQKLDIDVATGRVELSGVTIHAPKGHGTDPLLSLTSVVLDVEPATLLGDRIIVEELVLKGMRLSLVRDAKGRTGLDNLLKSDKSTTAPSATDTHATTPTAADGKAPPVVLVKTIRVEPGSVNYQDSALTGKPLIFSLTNVRLAVDGLRLFDAQSRADPATVALTCLLKQPGKLPSGYFGAVARMGPINGGLPPVNVQSRLIGLKLDTLGSLIPPATRTALGGDGLDTGMALALNNGRISLDAVALTDHNVHYDTIKVRGPLNAPVIDIAPVWTSVFRVTDGVLNIGKSGLGAGVSIAESGVDVVKDVASDTFKIGKKLLGGLFDTGKGLATLDSAQVKKGIVDSTAGTIELSLESVKGAGGKAGSGVGRSVDHLTGRAATQAWDQSIPTRYETAMQQARQALAEMPYPPVFK